ncbi:MAG: STAS domain-containing protein [Acidobacteriota bacterium]
MSSLVVKSMEKMPKVFILFPIGSLDGNTYELLEKKAEYLISEGDASIINIDMKDVDFISSMGVRAVIKIKKSLALKGGKMVMSNLQPQIKKVFEIINALPSLTIFASIEELDEYLAVMQRNA